MKADQRPWVGVDVQTAQDSGALKADLGVRNGGKGPALNVRAAFEYLAGVDEKVRACKDQECSRNFLLPGSSTHYAMVIPAGDIKKSIEGNFYIQIKGRIDYEDSDSAPYWTEICRYYDRILLSLASCQYGNSVGP